MYFPQCGINSHSNSLHALTPHLSFPWHRSHVWLVPTSDEQPHDAPPAAGRAVGLLPAPAYGAGRHGHRKPRQQLPPATAPAQQLHGLPQGEAELRLPQTMNNVIGFFFFFNRSPDHAWFVQGMPMSMYGGTMMPAHPPMAEGPGGPMYNGLHAGDPAWSPIIKVVPNNADNSDPQQQVCAPANMCRTK